MEDEYVTIVVGGIPYCSTVSKLKQIPVVAIMMNDTWKHNNLILESNGEMFDHVLTYLKYRCLPCDKNGDCVLATWSIYDLKQTFIACPILRSFATFI